VSARFVVAAAIVGEGGVLVAQRAYPPALAGLWELPGGKARDGEAADAALRREIEEELGVRIAVGEPVEPDVQLPGGLVLRAFAARIVAGTPVAHEHRALRWVDAARLDGLDWVPHDRAWVPALRALLGAREVSGRGG
jgi:8-oxo-dGTP diphosphatase